MDIDGIIRESFQQLIAEFETRKSSFLNIIHHNIDILVKNAHKWFGDSVPPEYTDVLNSLINLTIIYFDQNKDLIRFSEQEYEVFAPKIVMSEVAKDMQFLLRREVLLDCQKELYINTSRKTFKDACLNIVLCLAQFANENSVFKIKINDKMSAVSIEVSVTGLETLPELSKLLKLYYSYYISQQYHFRIGLDIPFSNIRKIGGMVSAKQRNNGTEMIISISFPSHEFLQTVDSIRKQQIDFVSGRLTGEVTVSVIDSVLEMVLRENLAEAGYTVRIVSPDKISFGGTGKALVVDRELFSRLSGLTDELAFGTILVICSSEQDAMGLSHGTAVKMPFGVQDLVDIIERRP